MLKATPFGEITRFDLARTIFGTGRYWTTAYKVGSLLVDTGCAHSACELVNHLGDDRISHVFNTHTHEDHIGANAQLQNRYPDLKILAHPLALPVLSDPHGRQPLQPYRRFFWGWPEPSNGEPLDDGQTISLGDYLIQVIYTPGHSPDHICFYEPDRGWLFTGDLFVGGQDRALRSDYDIWGIIASLKIVAALPISQLFPGSARVRENPSVALKQKIAYLEELGERILELHHKGWSVRTIARSLGRPMWVEFVTLGHFSRRQLVLSYLGDDPKS